MQRKKVVASILNDKFRTVFIQIAKRNEKLITERLFNFSDAIAITIAFALCFCFCFFPLLFPFAFALCFCFCWSVEATD